MTLPSTDFTSITRILNSDYCFSTTSLSGRSTPVLVYPVIFLAYFVSPGKRPCLILDWKLPSNALLLCYTLHHTHRPPSVELAVFNQSPFSDVMLTTTETHPRETFRGHTCSALLHQEHHTHSALCRASAPLSPRARHARQVPSLRLSSALCLRHLSVSLSHTAGPVRTNPTQVELVL
jgi:hypothetical protein